MEVCDTKSLHTLELFCHQGTFVFIFLPEEDQGYFITVLQLPDGASKERTIEVLNKADLVVANDPDADRCAVASGPNSLVQLQRQTLPLQHFWR